MIAALINFLVLLLFFVIVFYIVRAILAYFGISIPPPVMQLIGLILLLVILAGVLEVLGVSGPIFPRIYTYR